MPISLTCSAIKSPSGIRGTYKVAIGGNQPTHTNLGCSTSVHAVHVQWLCYYCVTVWRIWLNYMNNDYHGHWPAGRAGPGAGAVDSYDYKFESRQFEIGKQTY